MSATFVLVVLIEQRSLPPSLPLRTWSPVIRTQTSTTIDSSLSALGVQSLPLCTSTIFVVKVRTRSTLSCTTASLLRSRTRSVQNLFVLEVATRSTRSTRSTATRECTLGVLETRSNNRFHCALLLLRTRRRNSKYCDDLVHTRCTTVASAALRFYLVLYSENSDNGVHTWCTRDNFCAPTTDIGMMRVVLRSTTVYVVLPKIRWMGEMIPSTPRISTFHRKVDVKSWAPTFHSNFSIKVGIGPTRFFEQLLIDKAGRHKKKVGGSVFRRNFSLR